MTLHAGFAETDISPRVFPARTYWGTVDQIVDPQYAHAAVFRDASGPLAFLSLDIVIIEREYVEQIRERIARACPIPPERIMVCATHNHACGAVVERPWSPKDEDYLNVVIEGGVTAVVAAWNRLEPVETGTGRCCETRVSFNRRFVLKNGSVISQPSREIVERDVLFGESVIDPEVALLSVRTPEGKPVGAVVNFACHAVHRMGQLSAGFPGVLCNRLKEAHGADFVCVFLNGACGNIIHHNYTDLTHEDTMERVGRILADDVLQIEQDITYVTDARLAARSATVDIAYREIEGLEKNLHALERYNVFPGLIERGWYSWSLEKLKAMRCERSSEQVDIQAFRVGEAAFAAIPAEYFCQHALRIKEESPVARTFVATLANGWLGYIPDKAAFDRIGGHESTWCISSKMEPAAGDLMADAAVSLLRDLSY